MLIIGLTGPSGAGKGALTDCFEKSGIPVLDTDKTSREVCQKGKPCLDELVRYFGEQILTNEGQLDRKKLAQIVFGSNDKSLLESLNSITHRHITAEMDKWIKNMKDAGHKAAAVDAPQLFESGYNKKCDCIVAVLANTETRISRITERDKISRDAAENRIAKQKSDDFFKKNCQIVLYNNGSVCELKSKAMPYIISLADGKIPQTVIEDG